MDFFASVKESVEKGSRFKEDYCQNGHPCLLATAMVVRRLVMGERSLTLPAKQAPRLTLLRLSSYPSPHRYLT